MDKVAHFVGLDYHQGSVQVCVMEAGGQAVSNRRCANDWRAVAGAAGQGRVAAAVESCAGAASLAEELIAQAGWRVELAHPGCVARMKRGRDKSDFADARVLADLTRVGYLPRVWLAPEWVRELRRLVRYRGQLARARRSVKLRVSAMLGEQRLRPPAGVGRAWTKGWRAWLPHAPWSEQGRWLLDEHLSELGHIRGKLQRVEMRLRGLTKDDPVAQRLVLLRGVGDVTAWWLRAEAGRFSRFATGKQLARFCGLSPRNASSGERVAGAGLIRAGRGELRAALIQAAHSLIQWDARWGALAKKMREAGKPRSVVTAAVANRWVRWLHGQMRGDGRPPQEESGPGPAPPPAA